MIRIYGDMLTVEEKKTLRKAVIYTMDYLCSRRARKDSTINVKIEPIPKVKGRITYRGCCETERTENGKIINVTVDSRLINKRGKHFLSKFRVLLELMMHELVHVKQDLKNETFTYVNGDVRYKGKIYKGELIDKAEGSEDDDYYYSLPYEIEAYGKQQHLYMRFKRMYEREESERSKKV